MGESSACLVRSFSQPSSPTSIEEKKRNSLQRAALTSSISFGRFVSESLDWEKFSAFTQNRYLEEAEKFSKPGSVAEKKAYFEAHYKRRRAAALLEQQNAALAAASDFSERNTVNEEVIHDSSVHMELPHSDSCLVVIEETKEEEVRNCETDASVSPSGCRDAEIDTKLDEAMHFSEPYVPNGNLIESSALILENSPTDRCIGDNVSSHGDKKCEDGSTPSISTSSTKKKPECCSSSKKVLKNISLIKQVSSVQQRNKNSNVRDMGSKRTRSNSTSLHMSINFDSCLGESQKVKYPGLPKISNSKVVRTPAKKPQNSSPQTSASSVDSANGTFKNHSTSPLVAKRHTSLHHDSISGSRITEGKVKTLLKSYSKSSSTAGTKARSETVPSSFIFKSEERAARRKQFFEKLEQKSKPDISDKQQRSTKPQVTAGSSKEDHLKPNRNAKISPKMEPPSNIMKMTTTAIHCSPKVKERPPIRVQEKSNDSSRPPWKFSPKAANNIKDTIVKGGKNNRPPSSSAKPFLKTKNNSSASENTSPNIPLR